MEGLKRKFEWLSQRSPDKIVNFDNAAPHESGKTQKLPNTAMDLKYFVPAKWNALPALALGQAIRWPDIMVKNLFSLREIGISPDEGAPAYCFRGHVSNPGPS